MVWQTYLQEAVTQTRLSARTFAAFNANVDVVIQVRPQDILNIEKETPQALAEGPSTPPSPIETPEQFCCLLQECLGQGKSYYDVVDIGMSDWFHKVFPQMTEAMGGQAGIIANQMAALEAPAYVYNPVLSAEQAAFYNENVQFPRIDDGRLHWVPIKEGVHDTWTKVNFIFEYPKGETYEFPAGAITTPRANRIILGTRNPKAAMAFDETIEPLLPTVGETVDVGFMAGYHHGKVTGRAEDLDSFLQLSLRQLGLLKQNHPTLRLHMEYVPMRTVADEKKLLWELVPNFDSFGINENEITKVLEEFGYAEEAKNIAENERAFTIYQGVLALSRELQVPRIHLHNLGYYIMLLKKPYPVSPEHVRQSCLFASAVNAVKAKQGGAVPLADLEQMEHEPLSDVGLQQLQDFADLATAAGLPVADDFVETGIFAGDDHYCLVVPAHIMPKPVSTVGMGDTVSSAAFAAEVSLALNEPGQ